LCADRVDYSLREFPEDVVAACVLALLAQDNKIVLADQDTALLFAQNFLRQQMEHWGEFEAVSRYRLFADVLRQALKDGTISEDDFWQNDDYVVKKLVGSKNAELQQILQALRSKSLSRLSKNGTTAYKKFRYVDPLFIQRGALVRLSNSSEFFAQELEKAREINKRGVMIASSSSL